MPNVVFDASSLVGALLKADSIPERALLLARSREAICLSPAVEAEIRAVFSRPKFRKHLAAGRGERILDLVTAAAITVPPTEAVTDSVTRKTISISSSHLPRRQPQSSQAMATSWFWHSNYHAR